MITQTDVLSWLEKCRHKALDSVINEAKKDLYKKFENTVLYHDIKDEYEMYVTAVNRFNKCFSKDRPFVSVIDIISKGYGKSDDEQYTTYSNRRSFMFALDDTEMSLFIAYMFDNSNDPNFEEQCDYINEWIFKYIAVSNEYSSLRNRVGSVNGKQGLKMLIELGFDTTSLEHYGKKKINTDLLFVCNDNKPDEVA